MINVMESYINKLIQQNKTPSWDGITSVPFLPTHPLNCKSHKFSIKDNKVNDKYNCVKVSNNSIKIFICRNCDILEYITIPSKLVPINLLLNDQIIPITDSMLVKRSDHTKIDMNSFPLMLCPFTMVQLECVSLGGVDGDYTITQTGFYIQLMDGSEILTKLINIDPTIEFTENYNIYFYGGQAIPKERVPKRLADNSIDTDLQNKRSRVVV